MPVLSVFPFPLKCKTVEGVLKELTVFALIYNLVRQVMLAAAGRQHVDVERISFIVPFTLTGGMSANWGYLFCPLAWGDDESTGAGNQSPYLSDQEACD